MVIVECKVLRPGQVVLKRQRKIMWFGPLSSPWEDVECDTIFLSSSDYEATRLRTLPDGRVVPDGRYVYINALLKDHRR